MTDSNHGLSREHAECFARGLYYLASVDGIDDRERKLIDEFLIEAGRPIEYAHLAELGFSATEAASVLETSWIRRVFLKVAVALVRADGVYSDNERRAIGELADAFGLSNAEFGAIEQEASRTHLEEGA